MGRRLPDDVVAKCVLPCLDATELCLAAQVSRGWRSLSGADALWQPLFLQTRGWAPRGCGIGTRLHGTASDRRRALAAALHAGAWSLDVARGGTWRAEYAARHCEGEPPPLFRGATHTVEGEGAQLRAALLACLATARDGDTIVMVSGAVSAPDEGEPTADLGPVFIRVRVHIRGGGVAATAAVLRFPLVLQVDGARLSRLSFRCGILDTDTAAQRRQQQLQPLAVRFCVAAWPTAPADEETEEPTERALTVAVAGCCLVGGRGVSCLIVRGAGTVARLAQNMIRGGDVGVSVAPGASALIRANQITDAEHAGLLLQSDRAVMAQRNRVERCEVGAMFGTAAGAETELRSNRLERNNVGVMGTGECAASLEGDLIRSNFAGVRLRDSARPSLTKVTVCANKGDGVSASVTASPVLHNCRIETNGGVGILLSGDASAVVTHCKLACNAGCGAVVTLGNAFATVSDNEIYANCGAGVVLGDESLPRVSRNDIHNNELGGIMCTSASAPKIVENTIHHNYRAGIVASGTSSPLLSGNDVFANDGAGVVCTRASTPVLTENVVHANALAGIDVGDDAVPVISGSNTMRGNGDSDIVRRRASPVSLKRQRDEDAAEDEELVAIDGGAFAEAAAQ